MSQEPITVTYSLEQILTRLEQKIDDNQKELKQEISQLNQKIDNNQKELKQEISQLNQKVDRQSEEITTIKATLQAQQPLIQKIPDLAEKVGELKNWRQFLIILVTASVSGIIGWLIRGGNLRS